LITTEHAQAVVGVPVTVPLDGLMVSPAGSPVADQVKVAPDWESVAELVRAVMTVPDTFVWLPGLVTATVLPMVQEKVAEPWAPRLSVAVMVTEYNPAAVGVPEMAPVVVLKERPVGRPDWAHEEMVPPPTTEAVGVNPVMAEPDRLDWLLGLVTVTTSWTVQVNALLVPVNPLESVAVAVTEYAPPVVGVPEMIPPELMDRPGGAPDSDQPVMVAVDEESLAVTVTLAMAAPAVDVWAAGAVTVTTLLMVQPNTVVPWNPAESVAWIVAE
jgi:hypothetical protein